MNKKDLTIYKLLKQIIVSQVPYIDNENYSIINVEGIDNDPEYISDKKKLTILTELYEKGDWNEGYIKYETEYYKFYLKYLPNSKTITVNTTISKSVIEELYLFEYKSYFVETVSNVINHCSITIFKK